MPILIWNVAVTNVPGPREPLYFGGRRLESIKPVGFLVDDLGLMMAFISYRDKVTLGMLTCPDLVPGAEESSKEFATESGSLRCSAVRASTNHAPVTTVSPVRNGTDARVPAAAQPLASERSTATTTIEKP